MHRLYILCQSSLLLAYHIAKSNPEIRDNVCSSNRFSSKYLVVQFFFGSIGPPLKLWNRYRTWQWLDIKILVKYPSEHCLLYTLLLLSLLDLLPELEGCPLGQVQLGLHVSNLSLDLHSTILDCHGG